MALVASLEFSGMIAGHLVAGLSMAVVDYGVRGARALALCTDGGINSSHASMLGH